MFGHMHFKIPTHFSIVNCFKIFLTGNVCYCFIYYLLNISVLTSDNYQSW